MRARHVWFPFVFVLALHALCGCSGRSRTASERLRDAVVGYNDELRFGRQDLAVQRVAAGHRGEFIGSHYRWGRGIEIADLEIVNVEVMGEDADRAVSFVTFRWIATGTMLVRETLVRQEWTKQGTWYVLTSERVLDGEASLLEVPEGFRAEASGLLADDRQDPEAAADAEDAGVPDAPPDAAAVTP